MFCNKTEVKIDQLIDVRDIGWCTEAVIFHVSNGKGTLTHRISEEGRDYDFFSQLILNDKPIIQGKYPICPTCAGMLATGYGIENIESPELRKVRETLNGEYKGIMKSVEKLKPLLGLLNDGYYVLADTKLYPSDGQGNFFYSVPNELTYNQATCDQYYDSNYYRVADGYPAYIYPTQSADMIQEERIEDYVKIFEKSKNRPRAIAYYEAGFVCALLDGHHKACAVANLGEKLDCLTIIRPSGYVYIDGKPYNGGETLIKEVDFAGIKISVKEGTKLKDYQGIRGRRENNLSLSVYNIIGRKFSERYSTCYPSIHSLAGVINAEIELKGDMLEYAKKLIQQRDEDAITKLEYLMCYLSDIKTEETYEVAKLILNEEDDFLPRFPIKSAIESLLNIKNQETEQYMINYLVNHNPSDEYWDLVSSYWK